VAREVLEALSMTQASSPDAPPPKPPTEDALALHMHLVHRIVAQFVRRLPRSVQREDLVAAGTLGLFHALRSSEHSCEEMFASYARIRIRGAILDELRRHDWSPRRKRTAPKSNAANGANIPSANDNAMTDGGNERSEANVIPFPSERVARPLTATATSTSTGEAANPAASTEVHTPIHVVGFDDLPPQTLGGLDTSSGGASYGAASPLEELERETTWARLREQVKALPARERAILEMRYFEGMPSKGIASALGLSEARISQLHARATARLRAALAADEAEVEVAA
jgi:RNA polymerase sigma factor FliA